MKKITLMIAVLFTSLSFAQVTIGEGNDGTAFNSSPITPYYGYSYSQTIYLSSEINASGNITSLEYALNAGTDISSCDDTVDVWIGHTTNSSFASTSDWADVSTLTQVLTSGTITAAGDVATITFSSPFAYNGSDNLIIAIDANEAGYGASSDYFLQTNGPADTSLYHRSDSANADPVTATPSGNLAAVRGNVTMIGITQACPTPTDLSAADITTTTADLGWIQTGTVAAWNIEVVAAGTAPSGTATDSNVANPFSKTGLTAGTIYEFYVQADCGDDVSAWAGPFAFSTECEVFSVPYTENFDTTATGTSTAPTVPTCWSFIDGGTGYGYVSSTGANSFYMYNAADTTNDYMLVSPETTDLASGLNRVSFDVDGSVDQQLIVGTLTDAADGTTFTAIETITLLTSDYESYTVDIPAGTDSYLALKHGLTGSYDAYYLDNISIEAIPSCIEPSDLNAMSITTETASLTWTDNAGASAWNIELGELGFTPTGTATSSSVANPFEASSLTPGTTYEYYVQADCGGGDTSPWVGPFVFTTDCTPFTAPYMENFDGVSSLEVPTCWSTIVNSTSEFATVLTNTTQAVSDPNSMRFYNSGDAEAELILVSPNFSDDFTLNRVRFSARDADENSLIVGTMTDPTDASTFTTFQTITLTSTHTEYSVSFDTYTGTDEYVALKMVPGATYDYTYIDDFNWEAIPSCLEPSDLVLTGFTATSADIAWTAGDSETLWDIELVDITNGETVTGTATSTDVTNPYTIESLTANTEYEVYVRANCGDSYSPWVGPLSFFTGYCSSVPSSNDGDGISNLQVGAVDFVSGGDITYEDFTGSPVDLAAGINSNVQITFTTGYTYGTNIWIDFDDDLVFDASDLVYTGESTNANPTTLDASFIIPAGTTLGEHRMRIVTDDSNTDATNPCNSSTYGVTMDVDINIVEASCDPPVATFTVVEDCTVGFSVDIDVTDLGSGASYDVQSGGVSVGTITATGVTTVGPFTNYVAVDLLLVHPDDSACDISETGLVNPNLCPTLVTCGTTSNVSGVCYTSNVTEEWLFTSADGTSLLNITVNAGQVENSYDEFIVYDGSDATATELYNGYGDVGDLAGLTFNSTGTSLFIQITPDGSVDCGTQGYTNLDFDVNCADELSVGNFENETAFTYFPNPVKNTLTLNAQNTIEQVSMYNMLGQEVLRATPNTIDSELDMSQLQTGAYFVKVTIANITQTIRVIKQ